MFFFGKNNSGKDPMKMTVRELAIAVLDAVEDPKFNDALEVDDITKEQYLKNVAVIEQLLARDKSISLTPQTIASFRIGIAYGMGLMQRMAVKMLGTDMNEQSEDVRKVIRMTTFPLRAITEALNHWDDDHWFDALMKNAKIEEAPIKRTKRRKNE